MRNPLFLTLCLSILLAPAALACGDKAEATSTSVTLPVVGVSAETAPEIVNALRGQLKLAGCPKASCGKKARKNPGDIEFTNDWKTLHISVNKTATISLAAIRSVLEAHKVAIGSKWMLDGTARLTISGVSCGGCIGNLKSKLSGLETIDQVRVVGPTDGNASAHLTLVADKTLTLESVKTVLGAKFTVTDLILDSRCAPCSGFSKDEKAAGCGGCGKS